MKARPILMSAPMVQAIFDGRKKQTRRVIKPQPPMGCYYAASESGNALCLADSYPNGNCFVPPTAKSKDHILPCPYGAVGDVLWVREIFIYGYDLDIHGNKICTNENGDDLPLKIWYRATDDISWTDDYGNRLENTPWKPSIHMPRWASRITLEIIGIRVERLQDISEQDAIAEGIIFDGSVPSHYKNIPLHRHYAPIGSGEIVSGWDAKDCYGSLWESINGAGSWNANPFVWVIEFNPHLVNVDKFMRGAA